MCTNASAVSALAQGLAAAGEEFGDVVRRIAAIDTLDGFLRALSDRYPETGSFSSTPSAAAPAAPTPPKPRRRRPEMR
jgi:hypothetical protein